MANSKKIMGFSSSATTVSIPTAIGGSLVREIDSKAFPSSVEVVQVDTYKNDISGAPWGAKRVLWKKEPICSVAFSANGGVGSMFTVAVNVGDNYILPQCLFSSPTGSTFKNWLVGTAEYNAGTAVQPYEDATALANWLPGPSWSDNSKESWLKAEEEGWTGQGDTVTGFLLPFIDVSSTYNIPKTVQQTTIGTVSSNAFAGKDFGVIGGKGVMIVFMGTFQSCRYLTTISFPECINLEASAFKDCVSLKEVSLPKLTYVADDTFAGCTSLSRVLLPALTGLYGNTFKNCSALTTISLPNCDTILGNAFENCISLSTAYLLYPSVIECNDDDGMFSNCTNLTSIYVPSSLASTYKTTLGWSTYADKIVGM